MTENNPISTIKAGTEVIGKVLTLAGDSPHVKEAANNLGKAAVTATRFINNALLPIAVINYGLDKARLYFENNFSKDMEEKLSHIPEERIQEPPLYVAGPVIQGLAFNHEEPELKEMFLNLLKNSMDKQESENGHPSFVEIVKQISPTEAKLINSIILNRVYAPICQIIKVYNNNKSNTGLIHNHVCNGVYFSNHPITHTEKFSGAMDNFIRLGLLEVSYDGALPDNKWYEYMEKHPLYIEAKNNNISEEITVSYREGNFKTTSFGRLFGKSIS